jgi:uncharacterized Zn-binding protein involved in type VI secretion
MPQVARSGGVDTVSSPHGTGKNCNSPTTQATDQGVSKVYVENILAIHIGNTMQEHPAPGCVPHAPSLDSASIKVLCEGSGIARVGDTYETVHIITTGSSKVFAG